MSAETLRRAAALMRERARRAERAVGAGGGWVATWDHSVAASDGAQIADCFDSGLTTAHIASWHPTVALAVADWLDAAYAAWHFEETSLGAASVRAMSGNANDPDPHALAVARAYLGEAS